MYKQMLLIMYYQFSDKKKIIFKNSLKTNSLFFSEKFNILLILNQVLLEYINKIKSLDITRKIN